MKKALLLFMLLTSFILSCKEEKKDEIKLLITCTTSFTGSYIFNANDPAGFVSISSGPTNFFSITFDDLDDIIVDVHIIRTPTLDTTLHTLTIRIFRDDSEVKKQSITSNLVTNDSLIDFSYSYGEEENNTSTADTGTE